MISRQPLLGPRDQSSRQRTVFVDSTIEKPVEKNSLLLSRVSDTRAIQSSHRDRLGSVSKRTQYGGAHKMRRPIMNMCLSGVARAARISHRQLVAYQHQICQSKEFVRQFHLRCSNASRLARILCLPVAATRTRALVLLIAGPMVFAGAAFGQVQWREWWSRRVLPQSCDGLRSAKLEWRSYTGGAGGNGRVKMVNSIRSLHGVA